MPFYLKKSVKAGPFRFNFSKSGVGLSVGIKGLRLGTGPRGHYVHAGWNGIEYRASLNNVTSRKRASKHQSDISRGLMERDPSNEIQMMEIESDEVLHMQPEKFSNLLEEINSKQKKIQWSTIIPWLLGGVSLFFLFLNLIFSLLVAALIVPSIIFCRYYDDCKRSTVVMYHFEQAYLEAYEGLVKCFDGLISNQKKWHIESSGEVKNLTQWKRNAGASSIISRKVTSLSYMLPKVVKSNVVPPSIGVGKQTMFFFPDVVFIVDDNKVGAVTYDELQVEVGETNFIEDERVPKDSEVIGKTWLHPNKSGGPDRRFKNNYQIPICRYEMIHFTSPDGINEILEFSKIGNAKKFKSAMNKIASLS